tara:strand:+ start:118 stop:897 length:780 start_codon:yes stop_codon:yes gene_type:complete
VKICSLFSGIGGLELGLEAAGVGETFWQVEQDAFCRSILAKHWPDAKRFEDVRTVGAEDIGGAELLCGGFPCQDISLAGRGGGLAGERSGLWGEYARLIRLVLPRFVIIENVPALTGRGLSEVLGELAGCGYDAEWDTISAAAVGACHRRNRIFIIAWLRDAADTNSISLREQQQRVQLPGGKIQAKGEAVTLDDGGKGSFRINPWQTKRGISPVDDGVPDQLVRQRALGNAVVPQVAYQVGLRVKRLMTSVTLSSLAR